MPGLPKMPERRLVLCSNHEAHFANQSRHHNHHNHTHSSSRHARQLRQPRSLQGLLRYVVKARREDVAGPSNLEAMSGDRRKFLEDSIKSMTINVTDLLKKQIRVFNNVGRVKLDSPVDAYLKAFDTMMEYIGNVDIANDFHSLGGFIIFEMCLECPHPKIKGGACELLAEICHNNTVCQTAAIDYKLLPLLLEVLGKNEDEEVSIKSMLAISSMANGNQEASHRIFQYEGLHVLKRVIPTKNDRLRSKCTFFLANLCYLKSEIVDVTGNLVYMGYLPILADMLAEEHQPSHEYVAALLKSMMVHSPQTTLFCRDPKHNMRSILEKNFQYARARDACYDELQHLRYLLTTAFPDWK